MTDELDQRHSLRIRLEGRLETLEASVGRWQRAGDKLKADEWPDPSWWRTFLERESDAHEATNFIREFGRRDPAAGQVLGPTVARLETAQRDAVTLVKARFAALGLALNHRLPRAVISELLGHLPLEFALPAPPAWAGSFARPSPLEALWRDGVFGFAVLLLRAGASVANALRPPPPTRWQLALTQRALSVDGRAFEFDSISKVTLRPVVMTHRHQASWVLTVTTSSGEHCATTSLSPLDDLSASLRAKGVVVSEQAPVVG